ncbi:MAG: hypothetical protein JOZ49_03570 [Mycolicibacterium sp.]|nr:hypothetical protein [Mycolicibacterium sp.]
MTETLVAAGDQVPIGSLLDHLRTPAVIAVIVIGVAVGAWSWHKRKNFRSALINGMGTALLLGGLTALIFWTHSTVVSIRDAGEQEAMRLIAQVSAKCNGVYLIHPGRTWSVVVIDQPIVINPTK